MLSISLTRVQSRLLIPYLSNIYRFYNNKKVENETTRAFCFQRTFFFFLRWITKHFVCDTLKKNYVFTIRDAYRKYLLINSIRQFLHRGAKERPQLRHHLRPANFNLQISAGGITITDIRATRYLQSMRVGQSYLPTTKLIRAVPTDNISVVLTTKNTKLPTIGYPISFLRIVVCLIRKLVKTSLYDN